MNPTAIAYALQVLGALPALISDAQKAKTLIDEASANLVNMQNEKRDPTPAEWSALNARIDDLRAQLHDGGGQAKA